MIFVKKIIVAFLLLFLLTQCVSKKITATKVNTSQNTVDRPKLVVGIVVDQMRYDYLIRFYNKYGDGGFKRLINDGYHLKNVHFNYIPTYTAVGHSSIYTGTTPQNHGVISNYWYDKYEQQYIYCVDDDNYNTVGASKGGGKSPYRLRTTTLCDQLLLAQNMRGKTIGISLKDRSAILPVGHTASAAYWFLGGKEGKFITSTYYKEALPQWLKNFNNSKKIDTYLNKPWQTLYDINTYTESIADNNTFEMLFKGEKTPTFPHNIPKLRTKNKDYGILAYTPFGNTAVRELAEAAIVGEQLGKNNVTDFLAISFSSTDYIGHHFGIDSKEIEDTYIRLDKELEAFLLFLDKQVGATNYTLFLTADHAAVAVPNYLKSLKIPAGYFDGKTFKNFVNTITSTRFGSTNLVEDISNFQLFLNHSEIKKLHLDGIHVAQVIADQILNYKDVYKSVTAHTLQTTTFTSGLLHSLQQGYNQKFSGDILFVPFPATIEYPQQGSTHGSGYSYDTHVPLIFFGKGFVNGASNNYYPIIDIAPTIARLLEIEQPNGTTGKVITEVLKK